MHNMFYNCLNLSNLEFNFVISSINEIEAMFYNCQNLTSLNLERLQIDSVTNINKLFYHFFLRNFHLS